MACNFGKKVLIFAKDIDLIDNRLHSVFKGKRRSLLVKTNYKKISND